MDLGYSLVRIAEKTPGGILLFFPSYRLLESTYDSWVDGNLIEKIEKFKELFKEPKDPARY